MKRLRFIAAATILPTLGICQESTDVETFVLKTPPGQMRYDLTKIEVRPGQKVKLVLENNDEMPHNLVICKPGNDRGLEVAKKAWELAEKGMEKNWVPDDPRVLQATKMVQPHSKEELLFTVPKEIGDYPYVCTFPGHAMSMNGMLRVNLGGPRIQDLSYKLYLGSWDRLPDFSKLKPEKEGKLSAGLVGWRFGDYKNQFAMEFTGKLKAAQKGTYKFFLTSDDGSALFVDGQPVIAMDGIHPAGEPRVKDIRLEPGDHEVRVEYFEQSGQEELYLAWQGPNFGETPLSEWIPASRQESGQRERDQSTGIPLAPENGETIIYRNFIEGSSPRGICVGFPGGLNLCFDADQMNLALLWRGAFIDAKRHWSDRGGGNQPPLGYAVVKPAPLGVAVAVLPDGKTPWPAKKARAEGIHFNGYALNSKQTPIFRWKFGGLDVEETYVQKGTAADVDATVTRLLRWSGNAEPGTFLRVAAGNVTEQSGGWKVGADLLIKVESPGAILREAGGTKELVVPVNPASQKELRITYQWAL